MAAGVIKSIRLENLFIDLQNPRYDPRSNEREALATIATDQGVKLVNLAEDIIDKGLNPSELPIVATMEDDDQSFTVLEGNRRIAALKLISSPTLAASLGLSSPLTIRYKALYKTGKTTLSPVIDCVVLDRADANHWILVKHTGENEGLGVVRWKGRAPQRFRDSSPALQAIEMVEAGNYLDNETKQMLPKIAITNIERILGTPDARQFLGIDVKNRELILKDDREETLQRLAMIVTDVAHGTKKVSDLDTKDQRVTYAQEIAARTLTPPGGRTKPTSAPKPSRRIGITRKALIPPSLKLVIPQTRINRIYYELQHIELEKFVNCCAVMFRVFIELSVDAYAAQNKLSLVVPVPPKKDAPPGPPQMRNLTLREKIELVAGHLEAGGLATKDQLRGVRSLVKSKGQVLSVDGLNAYIHNMDYNPTPTDLKGNWDNVQAFLERIWT